MTFMEYGVRSKGLPTANARCGEEKEGNYGGRLCRFRRGYVGKIGLANHRADPPGRVGLCVKSRVTRRACLADATLQRTHANTPRLPYCNSSFLTPRTKEKEKGHAQDSVPPTLRMTASAVNQLILPVSKTRLSNISRPLRRVFAHTLGLHRPPPSDPMLSRAVQDSRARRLPREQEPISPSRDSSSRPAARAAAGMETSSSSSRQPGHTTVRGEARLPPPAPPSRLPGLPLSNLAPQTQPSGLQPAATEAWHPYTATCRIASRNPGLHREISGRRRHHCPCTSTPTISATTISSIWISSVLPYFRRSQGLGSPRR